MDFEIRSNDCIFLSGYVNAVERRSKILTRAGAPPFREFVRPGTFQKSLDTGSKVSLKLNHARVICDTESGLELREDSIGLYAKAKITDNEAVRAAREKKLTGWSFGFLCIKDQWSKDEGGLELRELEDIRLVEVSILTGKPAYLATSIEIREGGDLIEHRSGEGEIKIIDKRIPDAYQGGAFWIMNSTVRTKIRKLKDGQGNYLLVPDFQKDSSGYSLLGKPVFVTDNLPTATAAASGDTILYYGDFSGLAVKTGESAEIQMLLEKYAEQHAVGMNVWFELDSKVENTQKIAALALS